MNRMDLTSTIGTGRLNGMRRLDGEGRGRTKRSGLWEILGGW